MKQEITAKHSQALEAGPSVAVVQWTHTIQMKNAVMLARTQLKRHDRYRFDHHVILQSCGASPSSCESLRSGLRPVEENVTCFTAADMHRLVPATHRLHEVAHGPHGGKEVKQVGAYRWCWYSCDAAYIAWFVSSRPESCTHFWFLEWDVTWTGDLALTLGAWNSATAPRSSGPAKAANRSKRISLSRSRPTYEFIIDRPDVTTDLICANPGKAPRHWPDLHSRNISKLHYDDTFMCVTGLQRASIRLMRKLAAFALQSDAPMFCEMRLPSVCKLESSWCTMGTFFDQAHESYFFSDRTGWVSTYTARVPRAAMEARMGQNMLWHGYKWKRVNGSSSTLYDEQIAQLASLGGSTYLGSSEEGERSGKKPSTL